MIKCKAVLHHGPGHQSKTYCHRTGKHIVHECYYGYDKLLARWKRKKERCTGFFDEPPTLIPLDTQALGDDADIQ